MEYLEGSSFHFFFSSCLCFHLYPTPTQHTHTHLKCAPIFSSYVFWLYLGSRRRVKIIFSTWTYYSLFILLNFTILLSNFVIIMLISEFCIYLLWFSLYTDIGNHSFWNSTAEVSGNLTNVLKVTLKKILMQ